MRLRLNKMIDLENDDTIEIMDYVKVDILTAGQLEVDDLILIDDEVVSIVEIISLADGYTLEVINDFGEREVIQVEEYQQFDLMMLQ
jgi:hypothetical protein